MRVRVDQALKGKLYDCVMKFDEGDGEHQSVMCCFGPTPTGRNGASEGDSCLSARLFSDSPSTEG